jgi:tRNA nucleotidyltransferase (CCA-adding enzyme)
MMIKGLTLKGFRVPNGYVLRIKNDTEELVKMPGDNSGGRYSFQEVLEGRVAGWSLEQSENPVRPIKVSAEMKNIISSIEEGGGNVLFVGGAVRDSALGLEPKDIDVEVYGVPSDILIPILENFGKVDVVGASFGVIKLTTETQDYDFSLPRRENKSGEGHRGFIVEPDPSMTPQDAASRRDFSFNAMAMSPSGEVYDYFQGLSDLRDGVLRHASDKFAEDPLRVLRGFQFAGRFNMRIDPTTAKLANSLKREYKTIAKERVWGEWTKWAEKSQKPSAGLHLLRDTGWLEFYPEVQNLIGVQQAQEWHPEGDVWDHTLHVLDESVDIANRDGLTGEDRLVLIFSALAHDFGKPTSTVFEDGRWRSPGHAQSGMPLTVSFMNRIGAPIHITEQVKLLVGEHMAHLNQITPRSVKRLALRLHPTNVELLSKLIEADHSGRPPLAKGLPEEAKEMVMMARQLELGLGKPSPLIGGKHLMELAKAGQIPEEYGRGGPHFGKLLNLLFEAQLDGVFDSEDEGVSYVRRLLSPEYKQAVFYTGMLTEDQRQTLLHFIQENGMEMEQLWDKGEGFIRTLVE